MVIKIEKIARIIPITHFKMLFISFAALEKDSSGDNFDIKFIHHSQSPRILHIQKKDSSGRTVNLICNCTKEDMNFSTDKNKVLLENLYSDDVIHPDGLVMYLS